MKRFRFESFMKFIIQSPKYGTFTEAARTDPEQYSHDTWRDEFVHMENPQQLLWDYVQEYVDVKSGYLIADDTVHCCGIGHVRKIVNPRRNSDHSNKKYYFLTLILG